MYYLKARTIKTESKLFDQKRAAFFLQIIITHDPLKQRLKPYCRRKMTFFGDFYSKAGSIKQGFELSLPDLMYGAETYNQHCKDNCKIRVYTGLDLPIRESWKDGDIDGAS
jgi:hypothetical protein